MDDKRRFNQIEEQLSNTLRLVDQLVLEMKELKDYIFENNKVVNAILRKLDDHSELFRKNDERFRRQDERFRKQDERFKKQDERLEEQLRKNDERFEKHDQKLNFMMEEMKKDRELREAQFQLLLKRTGGQ